MDDRQYTRECDPKIVGRGGTVTARGMTVAWRLSPGTVEFSVHWPSRGWAAIGCRAVLVAARAPRDAWHHALVDGLAYFMLLAYSAEPDFDHHSLFRTEVPLMLLPSATTP